MTYKSEITTVNTRVIQKLRTEQEDMNLIIECNQIRINFITYRIKEKEIVGFVLARRKLDGQADCWIEHHGRGPLQVGWITWQKQWYYGQSRVPLERNEKALAND